MRCKLFDLMCSLSDNFPCPKLISILACFQPNASSPSKTGTLQTRSVTASQLATDSPAKMNGHYHESTGKFLPHSWKLLMSQIYLHCVSKCIGGTICFLVMRFCSAKSPLKLFVTLTNKPLVYLNLYGSCIKVFGLGWFIHSLTPAPCSLSLFYKNALWTLSWFDGGQSSFACTYCTADVLLGFLFLCCLLCDMACRQSLGWWSGELRSSRLPAATPSSRRPQRRESAAHGRWDLSSAFLHDVVCFQIFKSLAHFVSSPSDAIKKFTHHCYSEAWCVCKFLILMDNYIKF